MRRSAPAFQFDDPSVGVQHVQRVVAGAVDEQAESPLRRLRLRPRPPLGFVEARVADGDGDAIGDQAQHPDLVLVEPTGTQGAHVDHPDGLPLEDQGDAEERAETLLPEDRARVLDAGQVLEEHRLPLGGDAPGDAAAHRDADAVRDLLLQPMGRPDGELSTVLGEQEDHDGVGRERLADPVDQLAEQVVELEVGERRVGHALEVPEPPGIRLDLGPHRLLARRQPLGPLLGRAEDAGERADHQRLQHEGAEGTRVRRRVRPAASRACPPRRPARWRASRGRGPRTRRSA